MATPAEQREPPEKTYQDVSPLGSDDDSDLDNDPVVRDARDSTEVANHDHGILDEEEERENLLTSDGKGKVSKGIFGTGRGDGLLAKKIRKDRAGRQRKKSRRDMRDGEGRLMFEMEEGGPASDVSSQSSLELDKLNGQQGPTSRVSPGSMI